MKAIFTCMFFFSSTVLFPQNLRINLFSGIANYCGDIQQKQFTFVRARPVGGIGLQYKVLDKLYVRSELSLGSISGHDKNNKREDLRDRNLSFSTKLSEINLLAEYNLLSIDRYGFTPYFFSGIAAFHFDPFVRDREGKKIYLKNLSTEGQGLRQYPDRQDYKLRQWSIPYGAGIKWVLSENLHLGAELGLRKLFTDYLDDVSTNFINGQVLLAERGHTAYNYSFRGDELQSHQETYPQEGHIRGDPKQNDSYYFAQLRLSVLLAKQNIGTNKKSGYSRRSKTRCPYSVL